MKSLERSVCVVFLALLSSCGYSGTFRGSFKAPVDPATSPVPNAVRLELNTVSTLDYTSRWKGKNGEVLMKEFGTYRPRGENRATAKSCDRKAKWEWKVDDSEAGVFLLTRNGVTYRAQKK